MFISQKRYDRLQTSGTEKDIYCQSTIMLFYVRIVIWTRVEGLLLPFCK